MAQALALAVYEHDRGGLGDGSAWLERERRDEPAESAGLLERSF